MLLSGQWASIIMADQALPEDFLALIARLAPALHAAAGQLGKHQARACVPPSRLLLSLLQLQPCQITCVV